MLTLLRWGVRKGEVSAPTNGAATLKKKKKKKRKGDGWRVARGLQPVHSRAVRIGWTGEPPGVVV